MAKERKALAFQGFSGRRETKEAFLEVMEKGEMSKEGVCIVAPLLRGKALDVRDGRSWGAAGGQASRALTSIVIQCNVNAM